VKKVGNTVGHTRLVKHPWKVFTGEKRSLSFSINSVGKGELTRKGIASIILPPYSSFNLSFPGNAYMISFDLLLWYVTNAF
jgi:hypothetical protein